MCCDLGSMAIASKHGGSEGKSHVGIVPSTLKIGQFDIPYPAHNRHNHGWLEKKKQVFPSHSSPIPPVQQECNVVRFIPMVELDGTIATLSG